MVATPRWLVLAWRLPTGLGTQRVSLWRNLRKLGAVSLTPGAAVLPYQDELHEQLDWLAEEIEQSDGDAWVLPVGELNDAEERHIRNQMRAGREEEYAILAEEATDFLRQSRRAPGVGSNGQQINKELLALQRRFRKIRQRDYFDASGRREAANRIDRCLAFRQGVSQKLVLPTDPETGGKRRALHHARASSR